MHIAHTYTHGQVDDVTWKSETGDRNTEIDRYMDEWMDGKEIASHLQIFKCNHNNKSHTQLDFDHETACVVVF